MREKVEVTLGMEDGLAGYTQPKMMDGVILLPSLIPLGRPTATALASQNYYYLIWILHVTLKLS